MEFLVWTENVTFSVGLDQNPSDFSGLSGLLEIHSIGPWAWPFLYRLGLASNTRARILNQSLIYSYCICQPLLNAIEDHHIIHIVLA